MPYDPQSYVSGPASGIVGKVLGANADAFGPNGSPALRASLRRNALLNANSSQRATALQTRLMGLDPQQAAVANVNAGIAGNANTANALNQGELQQQQSGQDWLHSLLSGQLSFEHQSAIEKARQAYDEHMRGGFGAQLGQLFGTGLGGFLGNYFGGLGTRAAGGGRQSGYMSGDVGGGNYG
jgi:hypothetical protein